LIGLFLRDGIMDKRINEIEGRLERVRQLVRTQLGRKLAEAPLNLTEEYATEVHICLDGTLIELSKAESLLRRFLDT
jgi:hypothetical protein